VLLLRRQLARVIDRYLEDAEASVRAKRGRDVEGYASRYESSARSAELARYLIGRIEGISMADSLDAFSAFNSRIPAVLAANAVLVLAAALTCFMLLVRYSYKLTDPLSRLAEAARAVGRGEYGHELPLAESADEIGTTTEAFRSMQESVQRAFDELKNKAEVERTLMEQRMRVLDMDHKLKDAELLALQTQINPHFLFNTLSAGIGLALSEGADRTGDFLEQLAGFMRYALKTPSRSVPVADEIECVERYIWLLRLRFGERFLFEVEADEAVLRVETPALVLQPLVENAVTHGLKDRESGGRVSVRAVLEGDEAVLTVEDTGEGMSAQEVEHLLGGTWSEESHREGGIGLGNVMRRVSLVTGGRGRVELNSEPGHGTSVHIRLPAGGAA
jgi:two-component system sensor histidine kinase YesM